MTDKKPDMAALQKTLNDAIEAKRVADQDVSFASNRQIDALNRLNDAQKAFDAAVDAIRAANRKYGGNWSDRASGYPPPPDDWSGNGRPALPAGRESAI